MVSQHYWAGNECEKAAAIVVHHLHSETGVGLSECWDQYMPASKQASGSKDLLFNIKSSLDWVVSPKK